MSSSGIPPFSPSGLLPPYLGANPGASSLGMSPYRTTIDEFITRFNTSDERREILRGFLRFRQRTRTLGLQGWQWLDGSFLENIETNEGRAPRDLDVVTFSPRPASLQSLGALQAWVAQNLDVFNPDQAKANFRCDARFVDLRFPAYDVVSQARYWFGLFSHQRVTAIWKGMLELELPQNDADANARSIVGI